MYKCKFCGKVFEKQQGWCSHECKCKENPDRDKAMQHLAYARSCIKYKRVKDTIEYVCQYCGKKCIGKNSLVQHEIRCKKNPNRIKIRHVSNFIKYNEDCRKGIRHHPSKGKTKETYEPIRKAQETKKKLFENGELHGSFYKHHHSESSKEKMRNAAFDYLQEMKGIKCPRYNIKSIEYIDFINEEKGWHLQHALNGGEIKKCGFFLDGYDENLNIVFEYDEPRHYKDVEKNILNEKDIERQNYLISQLNCEFWRYNEKMDLLYKVN